MFERKIPIPEIFRGGVQGHRETQEQLLPIRSKRSSLFIGIPKETSFQENRISLTPSSVNTLVNNGHRVVIENGAGEKSNFSNRDYSESGADIAYSQEQVFEAEIILKVAPLTKEEMDLLHPNQIIISPIHLPTLNPAYIRALRQKRVIALAWEYIKDQAGSFPLVRSMSEMAGISSMLTAAELLSSKNGGRGVLLGGISGVPPAKVVILGAGVVAEYATRTALGLGAEVRIFDNSIYKLMRLQTNVGQRLYTSSIDPINLAQELYTADVAIGAIHSTTGRTPCIVSDEMVESMKPGSVIIDVSIDQGGCFSTSKVTTHDKPTFRKFDVIHYCVPNIASKISRTSSTAVSNIITPLLQNAESIGSIDRLIYNHAGLRHGVYMYKGCLTNKHLGERFQIKSTSLDLLLTSNL